MGFNSMITKKETEKLFLYCLEELRLIIENPYQNDALIERLFTVKSNLHTLYEQLLLKGDGDPKMLHQIGDKTFYSVPELAQKLHVTTVTIRKYLKQGKLKGKKVMGKWFILDQDLFENFKN